jgi:hypothetical protein
MNTPAMIKTNNRTNAKFYRSNNGKWNEYSAGNHREQQPFSFDPKPRQGFQGKNMILKPVGYYQVTGCQNTPVFRIPVSEQIANGYITFNIRTVLHQYP